MNKTAFIFPGQGAQKCGMGKDFYENSELAKEIFDTATAELGLDMTKLCFEENEQLDQTEYTQAAMVTACLAMTAEIEKRGLTPDVTAGLSLGEYCAISAAGGMQPKDAISLVRKRGILMQNTVPAGEGAMAAILGLDGETVEKVIEVAQRSTGVDIYDLQNRLDEAKQKLISLQSSPAIKESETIEVQNMLNDITGRFDGEKDSDDGKMHLLADLRRAFLKIEGVEKEHEWDSIEAELRTEFDRLEKANSDLGSKYDNQVEELRRQTDVVICQKDVQVGRQVLADINSLFITVTLIYQLVGFVRHYSQNFRQYAWKDANRARQLLNQGMEMVNNNPMVETLHPLVCAVIDVIDMPENEKPEF